jgi:hypothetical protein
MLGAGELSAGSNWGPAALAGSAGGLTDLPEQAPVALTHGSQNTHGPRFQFLFGALGALGVAAVILTAAVLSAPAPAPSIPWTSWKLTENGVDPAQQIAERVGPQYKLPNGHELVSVIGGPQAVGGQPVVVALRSSGSEPAPLPSNGVFYQLCGTGPSCSIPGKASVQRGLLVRREALELALYTFHYIGEASQVIVTSPPPAPSSKKTGASSTVSKTTSTLSSASTQIPSHVFLFRPANLSAELSKPLVATLPANAPAVSTMDDSPGAELVNRLTLNATYDSTLTQQESTLVMLLQSPSLGG